MKRKTIIGCCSVLVVALLALTATGCSKQKTCRCAVRGTSTVMIINIDKGECSQITQYRYHTPLNVQVTDTLVCTDYEFSIDTIYN